MSFSKIRRSDLKFGKVLAVGGFSTVYEAKYKERDVAAKRLNSPDYNEIQVMSKLDHENIVKLLAVVDEHPEFYLVLELCDGGSLRKYLDIRAGRRLPKDQLYDWAEQAAKPIEYLRQLGVIHKDIKSDNYVIATGNILKLTDFGLAKEKISVTIQNATQSGTPGYMAQEVWEKLLLSPTYDIFSYGTVLWELFTTETPFKGDEWFAIVYKVCHENERPPIPSDCPEALAGLMRRCWEVDTKRRPTIEEILSEIRCRGEQLRFFLLGQTGAGKSALGNSILGCGLLKPGQTWSRLLARPFRDSTSPDSCTIKSKAVTTKVLDKHISIVDTPGFLHTQMSAEEVTREVKRGISMISAGPHVVLIVLRVGRITDRYIECIRMIKYQLMSIDEDFAKFCIIVFTFTDEFDEDQSIHEYVEGFTGAPRQLLKDCHMRYVGFNNKLHPTSKENKEQVQRLLTMANELVKHNDGRCFTLKD